MCFTVHKYYEIMNGCGYIEYFLLFPEIYLSVGATYCPGIKSEKSIINIENFISFAKNEQVSQTSSSFRSK
jgi:hypothetical protein